MENEDDHHEAPKLPESDPENTLEFTEEHYRKMNQVLDILDDKLQAVCDNREYQWDNRVRAAKPKEIGDEHIIGIIGATGAGKSALLNAILDEEFLVPTSCVQACTAAVTEVAYNRSSVHDYRATVEFVSQESWRSDICTLLEDTTSSAAEDFNDDASEAAIALAKLSAVYPDLNSNNLSNYTVDDLINRSGLEVLGTSLELDATNGFELYTKLQKYVESDKRSHVPLDPEQDGSLHASQDIEYWPLIRKVRIFTKAAVLKTGCVLVDLPGIADVNAARGSIAEEYLAKCASLWIIVPILRAVDDKVGRYLLGERFKRQLRRDGTLGRVTFICSKADLAFLHELKGKFASDSTFKARMKEIEDDRVQLKKDKAQNDVDIKEAKKVLQKTIDQITSLQPEHDAYARLLELKKNGKSVHPPIFGRSKRKVTTKRPTPRKRTRLGSRLLPESNMEGTLSEEQNFGTNDIDQDTSQPAMSITELETKLDSIRTSLHELQMKRKDHEIDLAQKKEKTEEIREDTIWLAGQEWDASYKARNAYIAKQLQDDFKLGIRDLERAENENDADFDPKAETMRSAEQQIDLPVFCVASQAFQKLQGRLEDEPISEKFADVEQTGIPDLMRHCIDIGGKEIAATRVIYRDLVAQLLTSVRFWLSRDDDVSVIQPAGTQSIYEITEQLIEDTANVFEKTIVKIESEVKHVSQYLTKAAAAGEKNAMATVKAWGAHPDSDIPGLHHSTYRAVLRHGGVYKRSGRDTIDWIGELTGPMMRCVDRRWNRVFNENIPKALTNAKEWCFSLIDDYLAKLGQNYEFFVASGDIRVMFRAQFERLKSTLGHLLDTTRELISQDQAQANRKFDKTVGSLLKPLFTELGADSGRGVFTRVKGRLEEEMRVLKTRIFSGAARKVSRALGNSLRKLRQSLLHSLQEAFKTPRQDCHSLFAKLPYNHSGVSKEHQVSILETIREIEELLGVQTDGVEAEINSVRAEINAVKVEIDSQVDSGEALVEPDTTQVKEEVFTQPVETASPVIPLAPAAGEIPALVGEEESDTVFVRLDVAEGLGEENDVQHAAVQDDWGNIAPIAHETTRTVQESSGSIELTAEIDLQTPLFEQEEVPT